MALQREIIAAGLDWDTLVNVPVELHRDGQGTVHTTASCYRLRQQARTSPLYSSPRKMQLCQVCSAKRCFVCANDHQILRLARVGTQTLWSVLTDAHQVSAVALVASQGLGPGRVQHWRDRCAWLHEVAVRHGEQHPVFSNARDLAAKMQADIDNSFDGEELELWARRWAFARRYKGAPVPSHIVMAPACGGVWSVEALFRQWGTRRPWALSVREEFQASSLMRPLIDYWDERAALAVVDETPVLVVVGAARSEVVAFLESSAREPNPETAPLADLVDVLGDTSLVWLATTVTVAHMLECLAGGLYGVLRSQPLAAGTQDMALELAERLISDGYSAENALISAVAAVA